MHGHHLIHFFVNNVRHETERNELRGEEILQIGGFTSTEYKLVRKDQPDVEIPPDAEVHLHDGDHFLALKKQNPFSDLGGMADIGRFIADKLGLETEQVSGANGNNLVIKNAVVPSGRLAGRTCDVAIAVTNSQPFNPPPYFHTRPPLVDNGPANGTQAGQISPEWQYWSRKWTSPPRSPEDVWAWILTALTQAA